MVLPAILYGLNAEDQSLLLRQLGEISKATDTPFRVQMSTSDVNDAIMEIQEARNISLIVLGVESVRRDKEKFGLRLGRLAMKRNRDHYVVYVIKNREELELVLPLCARCAGIVVCPPEEKAIRHVFTPLFEDYHSIYANETSEDGEWINLKSGGKVYRIRLSDVCMVQAVDKMVEFHTLKQTISIYGSMDSVEQMLSDGFIRCHRSYFVNRDRIQFIDFREMTIHLMDGSLIPLARSFKDCMQKSFAPGRA